MSKNNQSHQTFIHHNLASTMQQDDGMTDLCQTESGMKINNKESSLMVKKEIDTVDLNQLNKLLRQDEIMEQKAQQILSHPIETKKITVGRLPNMYRQEQNIEDCNKKVVQGPNSSTGKPMRVIKMDSTVYLSSMPPDSIQKSNGQMTMMSMPQTPDMSQFQTCREPQLSEKKMQITPYNILKPQRLTSNTATNSMAVTRHSSGLQDSVLTHNKHKGDQKVATCSESLDKFMLTAQKSSFDKSLLSQTDKSFGSSINYMSIGSPAPQCKQNLQQLPNIKMIRQLNNAQELPVQQVLGETITSQSEILETVDSQVAPVDSVQQKPSQTPYFEGLDKLKSQAKQQQFYKMGLNLPVIDETFDDQNTTFDIKLNDLKQSNSCQISRYDVNSSFVQQIHPFQQQDCPKMSRLQNPNLIQPSEDMDPEELDDGL